MPYKTEVMEFLAYTLKRLYPSVWDWVEFKKRIDDATRETLKDELMPKIITLIAIAKELKSLPKETFGVSVYPRD